MCLYNKRLDRMTVYQSGDDFGLHECKDILGTKKKSHMAVRRYVGLDINKPKQEKLTQLHPASVVIKKRGRKQKKVLNISATSSSIVKKNPEEYEQISNSTKEPTVDKSLVPHEDLP